MNKKRIGILMMALSVYLLVAIPILLGENVGLGMGLWTVMFALLLVLLWGTLLLMDSVF